MQHYVTVTLMTLIHNEMPKW